MNKYFSLVLLLLATAVYSAELKLKMPYEYIVGNYVYDHSGNNIYGHVYPNRKNRKLPLVVQDTPQQLKRGGSGSIDFNDGTVMLENADIAELGVPFTINLWIKLKPESADRQSLSSKKDIKGVTDWSLEYYASDKELVFSGSRGSAARLRAKADIQDGKWHMVSISCDASQCSLYLDGKLLKTASGLKIPGQGDILFFGALTPRGEYPYKGLMDDFSIFKGTLTPAQIVGLYAGTAPEEISSVFNQGWRFMPAGSEIKMPVLQPSPKAKKDIAIYGRAGKRSVLGFTPEKIARAKANIQKYSWAREYYEKRIAEADKWAAKPASYWLKFLPPKGACYAYGNNGCPECGASWGRFGIAGCKWELPGKVTCAKGHVLPSDKYPDNGYGYKAEDGRTHYFIGSWNAWVTEEFTCKAIPSLAFAYALTGKQKYADLCVALLDGLASIYPESLSGAWDYPNSKYGRFAASIYMVSRKLMLFGQAYDMLYDNPAMKRDSLRKGFDCRSNIEQNLLLDAGYYCYQRAFGGRLSNGHCDYLRGMLMIGCLFDIPEYIQTAVNGAYSINTLIANNIDRDGVYYETTLGYGRHARELYLTVSEMLRNYRGQVLPEGINLYNNDKFASLYEIPELKFLCAGHIPNFGDTDADTSKITPVAKPYSDDDHYFAEVVYAGTTVPEIKRKFALYLKYFLGNSPDKARGKVKNCDWLIFNAADVNDLNVKDADVEAQMTEVFNDSVNFGQKGIAILRSGESADAQAALLRYGPSLDHGNVDDLALLYYAKGRQMTYDVGYRFASAHVYCGWARLNASHNTVCVNEKSQLIGQGSGGSLRLFGTAPQMKVVEAESKASYSTEKVSRYCRTVALVGKDKDQFIVDFFRVKGGKQHDYILNSYGVFQNEAVPGMQAQKGSLAGPDISWGDKILNSGDIKGKPGKPYWNPPPENGYGFFYNLKKGDVSGNFSAVWKFGTSFMKAHFLGNAGESVYQADAPGLYNHNPKSSCVIWRNGGMDKAEGLESCFVTVMEPYGKSSGMPGSFSFNQLEDLIVDSGIDLKLLKSLAILLLKAPDGGSISFALNVPSDRAGKLDVSYKKAKIYGKVKIYFDDKYVGEIDGYAPALSDVQTTSFAVPAKRGTHRLRIEFAGNGQQMFGLAGLAVVDPAVQANSAQVSAFINDVKRVEVNCAKPEFPPAAVRIDKKNGEIYYIVSSSNRNAALEFSSLWGKVKFTGAFMVLQGTASELQTVSGCAVEKLLIDSKPVKLPVNYMKSRIAAIDYEKSLVELVDAVPAGITNATAVFSSPAYTRTSSYACKVSAKAGRKELDLLRRPLTLGIGAYTQPVSATEFISGIPNEFSHKVDPLTRNYPFTAEQKAKSLSTTFLDGKTAESSTGKIFKLRDYIYMYGHKLKLTTEKPVKLRLNEKFKFLDIKKNDDCVLMRGFEQKVNEYK